MIFIIFHKIYLNTEDSEKIGSFHPNTEIISPENRNIYSENFGLSKMSTSCDPNILGSRKKKSAYNLSP